MRHPSDQRASSKARRAVYIPLKAVGQRNVDVRLLAPALKLASIRSSEGQTHSFGVWICSPGSWIHSLGG
eukprot:1258541-Pyramimonas_sp.AAC.1